jgi:hypothetical protein
MKNVRADSLKLDDGTVLITAGGGNAATSVLKSISATPGKAGKMDLRDNKLIVRGAAAGGTALLGSWNGSGYSDITGLIADDHLITTQPLAVAPNFRTTLGVATADQVSRVGQSFGGQTALTGDVLVMYTYAGDANLNGMIDGDDFFRIDSGYATRNEVSPLLGWVNGDFDYSGRIDADDYFLIDSAYSFHGSPIAAGLTPVPEPGAAILLAAVGLTAGVRRRRSE